MDGICKHNDEVRTKETKRQDVRREMRSMIRLNVHSTTEWDLDLRFAHQRRYTRGSLDILLRDSNILSERLA